jgi:hypothetical protein
MLSPIEVDEITATFAVISGFANETFCGIAPSELSAERAMLFITYETAIAGLASTREAPHPDLAEALPETGDSMSNAWQPYTNASNSRFEHPSDAGEPSDANLVGKSPYSRRKFLASAGAVTGVAILGTSVHANASSLPDMVVTNVIYPSSIANNAKVQFGATVTNQGSAATPAGVILGVSFFVDGAEVTWSDWYTSSLAPGQSFNLYANWGPTQTQSWTATAGTHTVEAYVNRTFRFPESNQSNNSLNSTFTVGSATLGAPVLPAVPRPTGLPGRIAWGSWSGDDQPSNYAFITSSQWMNVFPVGASVVLDVSTSAATNWICLDVWGNTSSGTVSGSSFTPTPPVGGSFPCGWYEVRLSSNGTNNGDSWGSHMGDGSFMVMNDNVSSLPGPSQFPNSDSSNANSYDNPLFPLSAGCSNIGQRMNIGDAANPTTGSTDISYGDTIAACANYCAYDANWFEKYGTANRPHMNFVAFPNGTSTAAQLAGVTQTTKALAAYNLAFEGPSNEPQATAPATVAAQMVAFAKAVRAGNPNAKVIGPGPVSFNGSETGWITAFLTALPKGTLDGLSLHGYNTVNGDMVLADDSFNALLGAMAATGYSGLPLWMTEGAGEFVTNFGAISWRNSAHWYAMRMLTYEVHGLPLQRQCQFYMTAHGFAAFPSYIRIGADRSVAPVWSMWRGFIERVSNAPKPTRLAMPVAAGSLFFGSVYSSSTNTVVVLMTAGQPSGYIEIAIGAGTAFTIYDWAGNTVQSGSADSAGHVTVNVSDLPTYVVCPVATTVSVADANNGLGGFNINLALAATAHSSSTTGSVSRINNGLMEDGLYFGSGNDIGLAPYADTVGPTTWFALTWSQPQTVSRIVLYGTPGWQSENAAVAFTLSTWNGTTWAVQHTYTSATAFSTVNMNGHWEAFAETFWDGQHNFDIALPSSIVTNGVLMTVSATSYGSDPDNAMGSPNSGSGPAAGLREIEVY